MESVCAKDASRAEASLQGIGCLMMRNLGRHQCLSRGRLHRALELYEHSSCIWSMCANKRRASLSLYLLRAPWRLDAWTMCEDHVDVLMFMYTIRRVTL